jgi:DNA (cytosine-5)-methyltransferase 1
MTTHNYFIDLFCGAGGVSTGISMARTKSGKHAAKVIACVNHDPNAILSHQANHPEVIHYTEDILVLDLTEISQVVADVRTNDPAAIIHLWASLECTNFSKAKGGLPRDADSRTLANGLFRYLDALNPDHVWIENVREFMSWGPLDAKGKPVSRDNGRDYVRWCNKMQSYGYNFDWRLLCCADFGDYTSRTRYFAQFARPGRTIAWPTPTHAKKRGGNMFDQLQPWKPVREVLDLDDHGASIFGRKKPLVENTLKRIYAGLQKFVGKEFIMQYYSGDDKGKVRSLDDPHPTLTAIPHEAIVQSFLVAAYGGSTEQRVHSVEAPSPTITGQNRIEKVLLQYNGRPTDPRNVHSIEKPCVTLTGKDRLGLCQFVQMNYTSGSPAASIDSPAWALTVNPKHRLATVQFMSMHYNGNNEPAQSLDMPARSITENPKHNLATVQYLLNPQYENKGASIDEPCFTLIARTDKRPPHLVTSQYLMDTHFGNSGMGLDAPCFTLTASRHHPYLVTSVHGQAYIVIYEDDSETMKQIKIFMAQHGIVDIKMRMLSIDEMKKITGLPVGYVLYGTDTEKKKYIGNAVPTFVVKAMVETCVSVNKLSIYL